MSVASSPRSAARRSSNSARAVAASVGVAVQPERRLHEVDEQVVGQVTSVRDAATLDPTSSVGVLRADRDGLSELRQEAALADARLTHQEAESPSTGTHDVQEPQQRPEVRVPTDHGAADADGVQSAAPARSLPLAEDTQDVDLLGLALELDLAQVLDVELAGQQPMGALGDEDRPRLGGSLHAGRHVHRVPQGRVLVAQVGAHIADQHRPRVDAGPDLEVDATSGLQLPGERRHGLDHVERGPHGSLGVVLVRHRGAEEGQHRVALELRDRALVLEDGLRHEVERLVHDLRPVLGVHVLEQCRRADDIDEERGHGLALAAELGGPHLLDERQGRRGRQAGEALEV